MYVADLIRSVSTFPISGLLLEEQADNSDVGADFVEPYRSVINVARHYRWSVALRLPSFAQVPAEAVAGLDAVIAEAGSYDGSLPFGSDISAAFAAGQAIAPPPTGQFQFVEIAPGLRPEAVLEMLARLRALSA